MTKTLTNHHATAVAAVLADEKVHELHGVGWSPARNEGVVLYVDPRGELICHYFDANGSTYTGSYSGSGDDPRGDFGRRLVSLGIAPRV